MVASQTSIRLRLRPRLDRRLRPPFSFCFLLITKFGLAIGRQTIVVTAELSSYFRVIYRKIMLLSDMDTADFPIVNLRFPQKVRMRLRTDSQIFVVQTRNHNRRSEIGSHFISLISFAI